MRYDVWHKPGIKPKKLSQGDSKQFVEDGVYFDEVFEVSQGDDGELLSLCVNEDTVPLEWGADPKTRKDGTKAARPFAINYLPAYWFSSPQ